MHPAVSLTSALTVVEAHFQNIVKHGSLVSQGKYEELWWIPPCAESGGHFPSTGSVTRQGRSWWASRSAAAAHGDRNWQDVQWEKNARSLPGFLFLFFSPFLSLFLSSFSFFFSSRVAQAGLKLLPSSPSARITGFPTILKFSGIVFLTTVVTLTGVSMLGYRAHVMIQGQFSRVGSLFPACGRTQGSNSECPAWGQVTESSHPPRRDISVIVFHLHNPGRFSPTTEFTYSHI